MNKIAYKLCLFSIVFAVGVLASSCFQNGHHPPGPTLVPPPSPPEEEVPPEAINLRTSLHSNARGMEYWYEQDDGFGSMSGVAYETAGCGTCHVNVTTCNDCHNDEKGKEPVAQPDSCLKCHGRLGKTNALQLTDLHMQAGMVCSDCHSSGDIHGDGTAYTSLFEPGAIDAKCENCHESLPDNPQHAKHADDLTCMACHTSSVITCYNCHFQTLIDKHEKKAAAAFKDFVMLVNNAEGKVTTASYQSVYYQGKGFVAVGPYQAHTTVAKGRTCSDCHNNSRVRELNDTGEIKVAWWDDEEGKLKHASGVIPFVPDKLKFQFVDLDPEGNWVPVEPDEFRLQYEFCTPLSEEQLSALGVQ